MKAVLKVAGQASSAVDVPNDLTFLQTLIGGYIEVVGLFDNVVAICDEEGKLKHLKTNFPLGDDVIVGTVLFTGTDEDEFSDLTDEQISRIRTEILKEAE